MGLGNWLITKLSKYLTKEWPSERSYLCDFDRICYEIRPADVLLIEGRNRVSRVIQRVTQSPWSHSALYIGRLHDIEDAMLREIVHKHYKGPINDQLLVESVLGKGTVITSIHHYEEDHIRICRPSGLAYKDAQKVIAHAINNLGKHYNIRHFLDLGRFLMASRFVPRRLKSSLFSLDPGQATQDICSAMIARAFASINFPILPLVREDQKHKLEMIHRNPKLYTPSDFDYSPYFNIIKYPLFPVTAEAPYRTLPWRQDLVSHDEVGVTKQPGSHPDEKMSGRTC